MKKLKYVAAAMLAVMLFAGQALADGGPLPSWDITDIYDTDLNTIEEILNPEQGVTVIVEDYNETTLVQYDSHDGFGAESVFGMRQVATTTPEPISSILFVTGGTLIACRRFFFPKEDD